MAPAAESDRPPRGPPGLHPLGVPPRQVLYSSTYAGVPPPLGISRYIQWVAEGLFCRLPALEFRQPAERWAFASACLRVLLQVVYDHDPDETTDDETTRPKGAAPGVAPPALIAPPPAAAPGLGAPGHAAEKPKELPAGFQLLCAFVKPRSPLFEQLLLLVTNSSLGLGGAGPHPAEQYAATALAIRFLQVGACLLLTPLPPSRLPSPPASPALSPLLPVTHNPRMPRWQFRRRVRWRRDLRTTSP